jgi:hypothetical protein
MKTKNRFSDCGIVTDKIMSFFPRDGNPLVLDYVCVVLAGTYF